ncbi:MAG: hypothetical protein ACJ79R_05895, partial [Anaeromyxobacteraceae bacterium]
MTIPTLLLRPALLAAAPDVSAPFAPFAAEPFTVRADPCDAMSVLQDEPGCGDAPLCSRRQRVQLAC